MESTGNCKYCLKQVVDLISEGLKCDKCSELVHTNCLKRGSVPGGLSGDIFFTFICNECSDSKVEVFLRNRMPWFQAIILVLYHISIKNPGLARKGYFHWKLNLATLIDKQWDVIFGKECKRKKKWLGAISGNLSQHSPYFFHSGTRIFGEQGWWTLTFPKLTPNVIVQLNSEFMARKVKLKESFIVKTDLEIVKEIINEKKYPQEYLQCVLDTVPIVEISESLEPNQLVDVVNVKKETKSVKLDKSSKKNLLPTLENITDMNPKKLFKLNNAQKKGILDDSIQEGSKSENVETKQEEPIKFMDPLCHYNTSLKNISKYKSTTLNIKLMGGLREELTLSPYTSLYLKPYIRRDVETVPPWLHLLAEIKLRANINNTNYILPKRGCIDYVYVQPSHIPAINSLCNQFFWSGIDLTDCLQYPDFSCVVLYRKLIIGFAFVVPDVKFHENYISFIFVRPGWRNVGIARFMIYHLIQVSRGKDLTLHVSINNPALFLYQKFGFKVEHVEQNFYDKYFLNNTNESKHAFFCRLER